MKMKKLLSLALALALCLSLTIPAHAAGGFTIEDGVLKKYTGPGSTVVIPDGVTAIGEMAFRDYGILESLKSVVIPDTVTNIGPWAFGNCEDLTDVTIPDSITSIGESAFYDCKALTNLTLPDGVTDIGEDAFWDCRNVTSFTIPSGISSIKPGTFGWWSSLTSITIPSNITEIGDRAFYQSGLTSITIPSSVKTIGKQAFNYCEKLTSVSIPDSVETIETWTFQYTGLTDVIIPEGVTSIGYGAFSCCDNLTSVTIPSSVTSIDDAFYRSEKLTIHGVAGSYAETYAKAKNIPFVAVGAATPDASAAPEQSPVPASPTKFTDVSPTSPFVDAINWAVEKSITGGKTATTFAPSEECTRGQILTFLWRANGSPEPTIDNPFTDSIPASFQKAAVWAYEKGLVSGAAFGSATPCTRAVAVEYLWKATGSPTASESASFADVPANANYAQAVAWAVENGVTGGTGNGQFSPDNTCTRGQIVTFLYRAMGK